VPAPSPGARPVAAPPGQSRHCEPAAPDPARTSHGLHRARHARAVARAGPPNRRRTDTGLHGEPSAHTECTRLSLRPLAFKDEGSLRIVVFLVWLTSTIEPRRLACRRAVGSSWCYAERLRSSKYVCAIPLPVRTPTPLPVPSRPRTEDRQSAARLVVPNQ